MAPAKHVRVVVRTRSTADFADNIILQPDGKVGAVSSFQETVVLNIMIV